MLWLGGGVVMVVGVDNGENITVIPLAKEAESRKNVRSVLTGQQSLAVTVKVWTLFSTTTCLYEQTKLRTHAHIQYSTQA